MAKYNLNWQQSDVQLLEALLLATGGEGGSPLQDILLMADAVDGTVFSLDELKQGLEKLISVNFVSIRKNHISLTPRFLEAYEGITLEEGPDAEEKPLMKLLQQQELVPEKLEAVRQQELKVYKLRNYYQQYMEQYG